MKKVESGRDAPVVSGVGETVDFSFEIQGDLMANVISSIYSERERTVVRELMANGFDSHVAAGSAEESIRVFLPTSFDPTFIVRDYGAGMKHDFVMWLFSKIGHSTKSASNEQTGMFGVGSKSPLSISDTYTVRCFDPAGWNGGTPHEVNGIDLNETGRVRLYTISITEANVPQISHIFDVPPSEDDKVERGGVEVKVPVSYQSRQLIIDGLAAQHFCWFDKPVEFDGDIQQAELAFYTAIVEVAPNLFVADPSKKQASYENGKAYVRQGSAIYPLDVTKLNRVPVGFKDFIEGIRNAGRHVMFDLPLGTCDVTMAREAIRYNTKSIENIEDKLEEIFTTFTARLIDIVGDARKANDALERLVKELIPQRDSNNFASLTMVARLLPMVARHIKSNHALWVDSLPLVEEIYTDYDSDGKPVEKKRMVKPSVPSPDIETTIRVSSLPNGRALLATYVVSRDSSTSYNPDRLTLSLTKARTTIDVKLPNITYFLPSNLPKWEERVQEHLRGLLDKSILPRGTADTFLQAHIVRCPKGNVDKIMKIFDEAGCLMAAFTADDLKPDSADQRNRAHSRTSVYAWNGNNGWEKDKVEPDYLQSAYYITRFSVTYDCLFHHPDIKLNEKGLTGPTKLSSSAVTALIKEARTLGYIDNSPIYRVTENQAARIAKEAPDWKHLPSTVHKALAVDVEDLHSDDEIIVRNFTYMSRNEAVVLLLNAAFDSMSMPVKQEHRDKAIDLIDTLRGDPLFKMMLTLRSAATMQSLFGIDTANSARKGPIERLMSSVYGKYVNHNTDSNIGTYLSTLVGTCDQEYAALSALCRSQRIPADLDHMARYLKGWGDIDGLPKNTVPEQLAENKRVTELVELFDHFIDQLVAGNYDLDATNKEAA